MIILIDAKKEFDYATSFHTTSVGTFRVVWPWVQQLFMIKTLNRLSTEKLYLSIIKTMYDKPTDNTTPDDKKLKAFSLRSRRERCPFLQLLFSVVLEVPSRAIKQEKEVKVVQIRKKEVNCLFADDMILYTKNPKDSSKISYND